MTEVMIKAEGLTKHFGDFPAVSDISFTINRGQVVAFLGPNGAGKSTTMRMLTGFIAPTHGRVGKYSNAAFDISQLFNLDGNLM